MKKYVLAMSVILCMLGVAIAQEKAAEQKPDKAPKAQATAQTGEVVSIDAAKNEVVIKDAAGAEVRLLLSTSTKITKAGKDIAFSELKVGDKISSECETTPDGCKAKSITVIPAPSQ